MADAPIALSRRPWWLWLLPLLPAGGLVLLLADSLSGSELPLVARWAWAAWFLLGTGALGWRAATLAVADYDAAYLYWFGKGSPAQIPLGSFFKLQCSRGYWTLHYLNALSQPQKLEILPLNGGLLQSYDASNIHGFIDAIWQHNPQLDVRHC